MTNNAHWPAIYRGATPVDISVVIPGSKSVTNRALILAAQAKSPSTLRRPLVSRDSELMVAGLRALGIGIEETTAVVDGNEELQWIIAPAPMRGGARVDVGNAGTVMRFLPPLAALATGEVIFDGDPRSYERPLGPVIKALEELGVSIDHDNRYSLPLKLHGTGKISGGEITIDASESSQFLSALLLVAPSFTNGITVKHKGGSLPSMPHIEMTVEMLRQFGASVDVDAVAQTWSVKSGALHGLDLVIEPDLSNASPFLSIALVCGGRVAIADWPMKTTQPGDQLRTILSDMGAEFSFGDNGLTIIGTGKIHGIDVDLHDVGELTPSIAALCALADSPSHLRGIGHLRKHETDRLAALTREINALGGHVIEEETALHITPAPLHAGVFHTYDDHRLATAGAVLGLVIEGIEVENIATTRKTLPDFPGLWNSLLQ
ncbi:MAG: 3-phosphoshikimate 1-carboxyvinyltransferase [Actinobacteria bacterium]|uniref:3-phosphoshikimate 1-carboxyvinyltransferase n=1 Tax=freshwater metagenome TaxID=449393 RepID=A0A6J6AXY9_9ZZZZ|nr:3-phosphoshikimate 1-carboxyvinyltransferase [Actinomycetota bacterium]